MRDAILFFANVYSSEVATDRHIPPQSPAGFNRALGLATALASAGYSVDIVSQGITWNSGFSCLFHKATLEQLEDGVRLRTLSAFGIPRVGKALSSLFAIFALIRFLRRHKVHSVVFYNYSFLYWLLMAICRRCHVQTLIDFEEATRAPEPPSAGFCCWARAATRTLVMYRCIWASDKFVLPASRLQAWLPPTKPAALVPYVIPAEVAALPDRPLAGRLAVLFSGPYRDEHGFALLIDAIGLMNADQTLSPVSFHFTGSLGQNARARLAACLPADAVTFHGFLDRASYLEVLSQCDVALALQLGLGSAGKTNVPSKAFEYLAAGKLVVVCDVGDFAALAGDRLVLLGDESPSALAAILCDVSREKAFYERIRKSGAAWAAEEWSPERQGRKLAHFLST